MVTDAIIWEKTEAIKERAVEVWNSLENEGDLGELVIGIDAINGMLAELRPAVVNVIDALEPLR